MAIVTLTSDIGRQDFLTGAVKGRLLKINPDFTLIDILHELTPFNYPQAAYMCRNAINSFPEGTFHLILVNLFHKKPNELLFIKYQGQYIGIANNGLITMILQDRPKDIVSLPIPPDMEINTLNYAGIFGKACQQVLKGKKVTEIGDPEITIEEKNPLRPLQGPQYLEGQIIFIDNFENVVINITKSEFEEHRRNRKFKIVFKRDEVIDTISETYSDVPESEKLALFNSANYLEIAINKGNAAGLFGLMGYVDQSGKSPLSQNRLPYETVKIFFE